LVIEGEREEEGEGGVQHKRSQSIIAQSCAAESVECGFLLAMDLTHWTLLGILSLIDRVQVGFSDKVVGLVWVCTVEGVKVGTGGPQELGIHSRHP
jgi:hypothetical protein